MNSKAAIVTVAAFAAIASTAARADDVDASQFASKFEGNRSRAEVMAEAATVPATRSIEIAGSRVAAPVKSSLDSREVRAQAAQALRLGQISHGETGSI